MDYNKKSEGKQKIGETEARWSGYGNNSYSRKFLLEDYHNFNSSI